jgi:nitric oxide dioxygenase
VSLERQTIARLCESAALLPTGDVRPIRQFYARLFALAPEVRRLFADDIEPQTRKLAEMLDWIVRHLEQPGQLVPALRQLGARHARYGVRVDDYAPVGSALIWMFQHSLSERFTPAMEEAWLDAFAWISSEMERGQREAVAFGDSLEDR